LKSESSRRASWGNHMIEDCHPLMTMDMWRYAFMKLSHSGLWGSKLRVFTRQQWSSEASRPTWRKPKALSARSSKICKIKPKVLLGFLLPVSIYLLGVLVLWQLIYQERYSVEKLYHIVIVSSILYIVCTPPLCCFLVFSVWGSWTSCHIFNKSKFI
jgi:hypothetical protein